MLTDGTWYNDPTLLTPLSLSFGCLSFLTLSFVRLFAVSLSPSVCLAYTLRSATNCQSYPRTKPKQCCQTSATHSPDPHLHFVCSRTRNILRIVFYQARGRQGRPEALFPCFRDYLPFRSWRALYFQAFVFSIALFTSMH